MHYSQPVRLILDNLRSASNVGAILRTADACGVESVYACGYTPYPGLSNDTRPPHVARSNTKSITKTALGAQDTVRVLHVPDTASAIREAVADGFSIIVIEQAESSLNLYHYRPIGPIALVLGNEVQGVSEDILRLANNIIELPMIGRKESLNVSVAAGICLYHVTFGQSINTTKSD